jgi:hypothetical protein
MRPHTKSDVRRKVDLINNVLRAAGQDELLVQITAPGDGVTRYEFAGWVYRGAGEAARALDAMLFVLRRMALSEAQNAYVSRAIDVARSDTEAARLLSPVERDELLKHFGGRR